MWYVYIICSSEGEFYTGISVDPQKRLEQHNGVRKGGARTTRKHRPHALLWVEPSASRSEALKREYAIKQLSHEEKIQLVTKNN